MTTEHDGVERLFPLDAPPTGPAVERATRALAYLVRYLNHATIGIHGTATIPEPQDLARIVGTLGTTAEGLPQLAGQLAARAEHFGLNAHLHAVDEVPGLPREKARALVTLAVGALELAGQHADAASDELKLARAGLDRLYLDAPDPAADIEALALSAEVAAAQHEGRGDAPAAS